MGKIVAISGGEIGRPGTNVETLAIDRRIIELSGRSNPKLLFIPTASGDSEGYVKAVEEHFGKRLGCKVESLLLFRQRPSKKEIEKKILGSDIIYVGGGNTLRMMKLWRKLGVDTILKKAFDRGIVLCGLSAGAICWFRYGCSDSRKFSSGSTDMIRVKGLDLLPYIFCPHYDTEKNRSAGMQKLMVRTPGVGLALDECTAVEHVDGVTRIIKSKRTAKAYEVTKAGRKEINGII